MPQVSMQELKRLQGLAAGMENEFSTWRPHFQELAQYILPRRYVWLSERAPLMSMIQTTTQTGNRASKARNEKILNPAATKALRILAAGMLNGITSPTRPWLRVRQAGFPYDYDQIPVAHKRYFDEVARRMLLVMAESNFYNALAINYLDLCCFGTSATIIYEDFDEVIRCYNSPVGEFRLAQNHRRVVDTFSRTFTMSLRQGVMQFGLENLDPRHKPAAMRGGTESLNQFLVTHIIEPNDGSLPSTFKYKETYFEPGTTSGKVLAINGYHENPGIFPRWELTANDVYGTSPGMDALPDIIQLQHATLRKAQSVDKLTNPPVVAEPFMANKPTSLLPGEVTLSPSGASFGAKAIYTVNPPLGEMTADIQSIELRIREIFHNDLFRMISNLETVRSATEIDARKEEKLVLLGAVLERFENEALDPAVRRIYNIMDRKDLLPAPPPELEGQQIEIEYVSVLSDAQRAVGTTALERFLSVVGNTSSVDPRVLQTVDIVEIIRDYADRLNIPASVIKSREDAAAAIQQQQQLLEAQQNANVGKDLTAAAANLSQTDVGGGQNAMQALLGG